MPSNSAFSPSHEIRLGGEATNYGLSEDVDNEYDNFSQTHKRSRSSDIQYLFDGANNISASGVKDCDKDKLHQNNSSNHNSLSASASSPALAELNFSQSATNHKTFPSTQNTMNSNNNFFSLTEDDDDINVSDDVNASSTPTKQSGENRPRRPSSTGGPDLSDPLFPIYEDPGGPRFTLPSQHDLDSTTGSEWGSEAGSQTQLTSISKEQLLQMLQKTRSRYHKYKGRYTDVANAYKTLESENQKVKNVMQQTQDKALRRISELKEQCQLEQKAKRHLEEELRSDLEEKEHIIKALQTKVVLLKSGGNNVIEDNAANNGNASMASSEDGNISQTLINLNEGQETSAVIKRDSEKVAVLEDKVRRLEALLTKCKESIKANKQKTTALTDVKDSLAEQLAEKEKENEKLGNNLKAARDELESLKKREQVEELQIAEIKMQMHQEIITKDEEVGKLRTNLKHIIEEKSACNEQIEILKNEVDHLKQSQDSMEKSAENEKMQALQEMSRGKAGALQTLKSDMEEQIKQLKLNHAQEKEGLIEKLNSSSDSKLKELEKEKLREITLKDEEIQKLLAEKDEESRLAVEEMELRLTALSTGDDAKSKLLGDLENRIQKINSEKKELEVKLTDMSKKVKQREIDFKQEQKSHGIIMEQKVSDLTKQIQSKESSLQESQNQVKSLSERLEQMTSEVQQMEVVKKELQDEMNANSLKYEHIKEAHDKTIGENTQLKNKENDHTREVETLKKECEALEQKLRQNESDLNAAKDDHDTRVKALQQKLQEISVDTTNESQKHLDSQLALVRDQHMEEMNSLQASNSDLNKKLEEYLGTLQTKEEALAEERLKSNNLETENCKIEDRLKELERSLKDAITNAEKSQSDEKNAIEQLEAKEAEISRLKVASEENERISEQYKIEKNSIQEEMKIVQQDMNVDKARLKEVETALAFANEDICKKSQLLEEKETTVRDHIEKIHLFETELEALNKQLNEFQLKNEKAFGTIADLERDNLSLKNSNASTKDLKQQMITYQKELQEQISQAENHEKTLKKQNEELQILCCDKDNEIKSLVEKHICEVNQLKSDLELKIRLEREKETSFKELQVQSIEYQKKLQEKLEEKEKQYDVFNLKFNEVMKSHSKEVETASNKIDHLTAKINDIEMEKNKYKSEIESLNDVVNNQSDSMQELIQMKNKVYELESSLKIKSDEVLQQSSQIQAAMESNQSLTERKDEMEIEKSTLIIQVEELKKEVTEAKDKIHSLENNSSAMEDVDIKHKDEINSLIEKIKAQEESSALEMEKYRQNIVGLENKLSTMEKELRERNSLLMEEKDATTSANLDLQKARNELQGELDSSKQELHELQMTCKSKDSEVEDLKSRMKETNDIADSLRKDLTASQEDKAAQLLEYEETLEDLEKQVSEQKEKNAQLQEQIAKQSREIESSGLESSKNADKVSTDHSTNIKTIIKEYEKKLAENGAQHDEEIMSLKEATEHEIKVAVGDCRRQITELKEELYEKTSLYEDMIDRHAAELAAKQKEMDEEVEACSRLYQTKLNELQNDSERLASLAAAAASGSIGK